MEPDSFAPAFAFDCSRLSDSETLPAAPAVVLSLWLVFAPPPCRSLAARLCRVCVHFNKNIFYFAHFIPENVQNVGYFAFFAQNIWQFQKNVLPLHRI